MIILGIETSCDETAVAIAKQDSQGITILSHVLASSAQLHAKWGGVIPEQAAREQLKVIIPNLQEALDQAALTSQEIDALAVTQGPGLIGSLLVGVETAKSLSLTWNKPLIPVNHLLAHFYACWTSQTPPPFPFLGLLVSGGHTDLLLFKDHNQYQSIGSTRDDAAGECFDKCARLLDLPYLGGPLLAQLAQTGDPKKFKLPRPMIGSNDYDFSFSGLKTAVSIIVENLKSTNQFNDQQKQDLAASIELAIVETLVKKTLKAAQQYDLNTIVIAGGVAANKTLRHTLQQQISNLNYTLFIPPINLCTDNAVTTTIRAFFDTPQPPLSIQANPNLSLTI